MTVTWEPQDPDYVNWGSSTSRRTEWHVVEHEFPRGTVCIKDANGNHIGYGYGLENARKAAAAPELLEALDDLVSGCNGGCKHNSMGEHTAPCITARAAIAKARGEL